MSGRAARLTAPGVGGLHVFGLAGDGVGEFLERCFHPVSRGPDATNLHYGRLMDGDELVDEAIVHRIRADRADVSVHGSLAVAERLERLLEAQGFDLEHEWKEEGEGLIHGEARAALRETLSSAAVRYLATAMDGRLESEVARLRERNRAGELAAGLEILLARSRFGTALVRPPKMLLTGPANVGKSTLFNRLLSAERVITSPHAGTTRDVVEAPIELDGYPFRLADSAGIRAATGDVEAEGIARAEVARGDADLVLEIRSAPDGAVRAAPHPGAILVFNKIDLVDGSARARLRTRHPEAVAVSAASGEGIDDLAARVLAASPFAAPPPLDVAVPFTARQVACLREALAGLSTGPEATALALDALVR